MFDRQVGAGLVDADCVEYGEICVQVRMNAGLGVCMYCRVCTYVRCTYAR
jgi:hypothetical protein